MSSLTSWYFAFALVVAVAAAARGIWSPCGLSMISAINPISERSRGNRYWLTATWFIAGAVVGGATLGGLAAVGALLWSPLVGFGTLTAGVAVLCCLTALVSDGSMFSFRLPGHPRQVNEQWLGRYRRWVYAAGFGWQIGTGFATYNMTAAVYLTVALAVFTGSPMLALLVGLVFGLVRGSAVLLSSRVRRPAELRMLHERLDRLAPWSLVVAMFSEAFAAVAFGYFAFGWLGAVVIAVAIVGCAMVNGSRPTRGRDRAGSVAPAALTNAP